MLYVTGCSMATQPSERLREKPVEPVPLGDTEWRGFPCVVSECDVKLACVDHMCYSVVTQSHLAVACVNTD